MWESAWRDLWEDLGAGLMVFGGFCLWGGSGSRGCFHDDLLQPKSLIISIDEMVNWQKKSMEISLLLNASTNPVKLTDRM